RHRDPRERERDGVGLDLRGRLRGVLPRDAHREDEAPLQVHDRLGERAARARVLQRRHQAVPPRAAQGEMTMNYGLVLLSLVTASATSLAAQSDFHWRGKIATGKEIEIKGVNGDVRAVAGSGGETEATATKRAKRSDPDHLKIGVVEQESGGTTRAVYAS